MFDGEAGVLGHRRPIATPPGSEEWHLVFAGASSHLAWLGVWGWSSSFFSKMPGFRSLLGNHYCLVYYCLYFLLLRTSGDFFWALLFGTFWGICFFSRVLKS